MRLIVDSQRVSEHEVAAMVRGDGALEGVTAWASSERAAIQQAINVYFRDQGSRSGASNHPDGPRSNRRPCSRASQLVAY
jgi:hypothetical protein